MRQVFRGLSRKLGSLFGRAPVRQQPIRSRRQPLQLEQLEKREMLTLGAPPIYPLPTGNAPLDVATGRLDNTGFVDLAVLGADGHLTLAHNKGDGTWASEETLNLGTGPANGLLLTRLDASPFADLVLQGPNQLTIAHNDGTGHFGVVQTLTPAAAGQLAPTGGGRVTLATGQFDADLFTDVAAPVPGTDEVLVFHGKGGILASTPDRFASGGHLPVAVVTGQFAGDGRPDLAVGHRDGSVTFFEGLPDGHFRARPDLTVTGLGAIGGLAAADFNGDGNTDLVVSSPAGVTYLQNKYRVVSSEPVVNGNFDAGLTGWQATPSDSVGAGAGYAQFRESTALLTTLQQSFVVPSSAQTVSFDIVSLGLEDPAGGVPDAFEASLLNDQSNSVVPTFRSDATSFFNANPGGTPSLAAGATFDGRHVTLDVSHVAPGTHVTLYFDLIGNPPGQGSVAAVDNVRLDPAVVLSEGFTPTALPGPFGQPAGLAVGDINGDGHTDVVVADSGLNQLLVYNGDGAGNFTRDIFDVSPYGSGPQAVALGTFTPGSALANVAVTLPAAGVALTPIVYDITPPQVSAFDPADTALSNVSPSQLHVHFSEAMRNPGPAAAHSAGNAAAYVLTAAGPDGVFGTADDVRIPLQAATYDPATFTTTLTVAAAFAPLADGRYQLTVAGADASLALLDLGGNRLGSGQNAVATFTIDTTPPLADVIDPAPSAILNTRPTLIHVHFSEAMANGGPTAAGSVTNPASYALFAAGADQRFEAGGDDVRIPIGAVAYDPATLTATLTIAAAYAPLADEHYEVVLKGSDPAAALRDLAGNLLAAGKDVTSLFTVDTVPPQAAIVNPAPGALLNQGVSQILVQFTEAMRDAGPAGPAGANSVTNLAAYTLVSAGPDGILGNADDVTVPLAAVSYDARAFQASLQVAAALTDGSYRVTVKGADLTHGLRDLAGNRLGGGTDVTAAFTIDTTPPQATILTPAPGALLNTHPSQIVVRFSEAMLDNGTHAVSSAANYALYSAGPNGVLDGGKGDDVPVPLSAVSYSATTHQVTLTVAAPLADSVYLVVLAGADPTHALLDLAGNKLHGGMDATSTFTVDTTPPQVVSFNPAAGAVVNVEVRKLQVHFSEAMLATGTHAVTNLAAYQLLFTPGASTQDEDGEEGDGGDGEHHSGDSGDGGGDGQHQGDGGGDGQHQGDGGGDGQHQGDGGGDTDDPVSVPITAVSYDPVAHTATLTVTAPLADGYYRLTVKGQDPVTGLTDLAGNRLGGATDATDTFTVDRTPPTATVTLSPHVLWPANHRMATITANITVSDPMDPHPHVVLLSVTSSEADSGLGGGDLPNDIQGVVVGTDDRQFQVRRERAPNGPGRVYTATYYVYDAAGNGRVVSASVLVPHNQDDEEEEFNHLGDPTPHGLGHLHTTHPGFFVDPALTLNQVTNGTLAPNEITVWDFQGTAGQRLFFDPQQADDNFIWVLAGPGSQEIFNSTFFDTSHGVVVLPATGTYTLTIEGDSSFAPPPPSGAYQFEVWNVPAPVTTPTAIGLTLNGSIDVPGQQHLYTFSARPGQRVFFNAQQNNSNGGLHWTLLDPQGQQVFSDNFFSEGPTALTATGQYTLRLEGNGNATGSYQFQLVNAPTNLTAIAVGDKVSGSLTQPYQEDVYTFTGAAGQRVFFNSQVSYYYTFNWALTAPDGTSLFNGYLQDEPTQTLPAAGTYTLRVHGSYTGATGQYAFQLWSVPAPVTATLTLNTAVSGILATPGAESRYTFTGASGQRLFLLVTDYGGYSAGKSFALLAPDGSVLLSPSSSSRDTFTLTANGTYTVVVDGSSPLAATGSYGFTLYQVPDPTTVPLTLGAVVSANLAVPGEQDHYAFTGAAGQRLFLNVQDAGYYGNYKGFTVYNPDGTVLRVATTANSYLPALPQNGTYTLVVAQYNNIAATGSYRFVLFESPQPAAVPVSIGASVDGAINALGEFDHYTFNGAAGELLFFETLSGYDYQFHWRLVGPAGDVLFDSSFSPPPRQTLATTGTYTLEVTAAGVDTGAYRFRIDEVPTPVTTPIQTNQAVSGTLSVPGELDLFTFNATQGQHLYFQLLTGNTYDFRWYLLDPSGQELFNTSAYDYNLQGLSATGTYTFGLEGYRGHTGNYQFKVWNVVETSTAIALATPVSGNLPIRVASNAYTFSASAGHQFYFNVLTGQDLNLSWSLTDPNGQQVFYTNFANEGPDTLPTDGTYTLRVFSSFYGGGTGDYSFQVVDVQDQPPVAIHIGDVVNGNLTLPGERDRYTFAATAGERLSFAAQAGSAAAPQWTLTDPAGNQTFQDAFNTRYEVLSAAGTYTLAVSSPGGLTGPYQFQLTDAPLPAPTPIALGQVVSSQLAVVNDIGRYSITVADGQRVFFDAQTGSSYAFHWKATGPLGTLFDTAFSDFDTTVLGAGTYVIEVTGGSYGLPAAYSFELWDVPATVDVPIQLNQAVAGTLATPGVENHYTFAGTAGQRVYFAVQSNSYTGYWGYDRKAFTLLGPDGRQFVSNVTASAPVVTLTETGTYTIAVDEWQNPSPALDATGDYRFAVWDVVEPTPEPLTLGQWTDAVIGRPLQEHAYTFTGTVGERVFLDMTNSFTVFGADLRRPDGTQVFERTSRPHYTVTLDQAGTYTVRVGVAPGYSIDWTGDLNFRVLDVPAIDVTPITVEQRLQGSIDIPGQERDYTFTGAVGERLMLDMNYTYTVEIGQGILRPDGTELLPRLWGDRDVFVLDQAGTYTVRVGSSYYSNGTGGYDFTLHAVPVEETRPTLLDNAVAGAVSQSQRLHYTFTGHTGERLFFNVIDNAGGVRFALQAPDGSVVFGGRPDNLWLDPLPQDGTYTLTAAGWIDGWMNDRNAVAGSYHFQMQEVPTARPGPLNSQGTEFWVGFPDNFQEDNIGFVILEDPAVLILYLSSQTETSGVISIPGLNNYGTAFHIAAGGMTSIRLPSDAELNRHDQPIQNKGIHILSFDPISVYGFNQWPASTDAFLGLPTQVLGTDYVVMSYPGIPGGDGSSFAVVATQDNTTVQITPTANAGGQTAGVAYTITLNQGQAYQLVARELADLTGTTITASKPVSVFGSNVLTRVPDPYKAANHLVEQLTPVTAWGRHFITAPLATRHNGDRFRFLAAHDGTELRINGAVVATLNRGQFYESVLVDAADVAASQPILVAQFSQSSQWDQTTGDPSMTLLPPYEQFEAHYTVAAPSDGFPINYINVVVATAGVGSVTLDGTAIAASAYTAVGTSGFSYAQVAVTPGTHTLAAALPFGVTSYGFATYDAYGYAGGMSLAPVSAVAGVDLEPKVTAGVIGVPAPFVASLRDTNGAPVAGVRVDFQVTGANAVTGFAVTDALGQASFSYAGANAGSDTVQAAVGSLTDSATVSWSQSPPTVAIESPATGSAFAANSTVLVTGVAQAGSPLTRITLVTINGQPVDGLDVTGRFFARVTVSAGSNDFTIVARDSSSLLATATLTLTGTSGGQGLDFTNLQDVTARGALAYSATTYDRRAHVLHADAQLVNTGADALPGPVAAVFTDFTAPAVTLTGTPALNPAGQPYVTFAAEVPAGGLAPAASSAAMRLGFAAAPADRFAFNVTLFAAGNRPPAFTSAPRTDAVVGKPYTFTATAADPDGDALRFDVASGPQGLSVGPTTGLVSWTPVAGQEGLQRVELLVSDGRSGVGRQTFSVLTEVTPANRAPVFRSVPLTSSPAGANYDYRPDVFDADGDTLIFTLDAGPAGMTADRATGELKFAAAPAASYTVKLRVDDGRGGEAVQQFVLAIGGVGSAVALVSTPPTTAVVGQQYAYQIQVQASLAVTYTLVSGPTGLSVDQHTGLVLWTPAPTQLGPYTVALSAADAVGGAAVQTYTVTAFAAPVNRPPAITSSPGRLAMRGLAYTYQVTATDPDGDAVTFALADAPAGMQIEATTGAVTWTPAVTLLGSYLVTVTATDTHNAVGRQSYLVEVRDVNRPPHIDSNPVLTVTAGAAYRYRFHAVDDADAISYSLVGSPTGMVISPDTGLILWQTALKDLGAHAVTLRVTDERGATADQAYTLTVVADTEAPTVAIVPGDGRFSPGTTITVHVFATDNVGVTGRTLLVDGTAVTLAADGGYTFTVTTPGAVHLTATAVDAAGNVGTATAKLRVTDPNDTAPPAITLTSPQPNATVSYLTNVVGTITDAHLDSYRVEVALLGSNEFHLIAQAETVPANGVLAVFDPTLLENDVYVLRVTADDVNGNESVSEVVVNLTGNAKVGNFRTGATDVTIPVAGGLPLEIKRVYDTTQANVAGDLGYGWQICALEPRIHETVPVNPGERLVGMFAAVPFKDGDKVYLTTPDCQRVGFTFHPVPTTGIFSILNGDFGTIYEPRWVADPGVEDTLYGEFDRVVINGDFTGSFDVQNGYHLPLLRLGDGSFILPYLNVAYNPLGYRLVRKDGTVWHYGQFDGLEDVTDRSGNKLTVTANGITSSSGVALQFERDAQGRITKITDPAGAGTKYEYNAKGELQMVDAPNGLGSHYQYNGGQTHFLSDVNTPTSGCDCAPNTPPMQVTYDLAGRVKAMVDGLGHATQQAYDLATNTERVADALGNVSTLVYDARGNVIRQTDPLGAVVVSVYDANDNLTSHTDGRGFTTAYTYDAHKNLTSLTDPLGATTLLTYGGFDKLTHLQLPDGLAYDTTYDASGHMIRMTGPLGATSLFTNDQSGRVTSVTDPNGHVTQFVYDSTGANPNQVILPDGSRQQYVFDADQRLIGILDENGHRTDFQRDSTGRVLTITDALGQKLTFNYDGQYVVNVVDKEGHTTTVSHDDAGRLSAVTDTAGNVTRYAYDAAGQMVASTDPLGRTSSYTYRADGRLGTTIDALGQVTTYDYDAAGNRTAVTDANGHKMTFGYDARNQLTKQADALGDTWVFAYDLNGRRLSATDPNGHSTHYTYDVAGSLSQVTDPLGGVTSYAYDLIGNLTGETNANGQTTQYTYNALDRVVREVNALFGARVYAYDAVGNTTSQTDELGRTTTFGYDALNRPVTTTDPLGGIQTWVYSANDHPTSSTDPLGRTTRFAYDQLDRVTSTTDPLGGVQSFQYDVVGNLLGATDALGHTTGAGYDALNRRTTTTDALGNVSHFTYDAVGNLTAESDPLGRTAQYAYDAADRLLTATDPSGGVLHYAYDAAGNTVTMTDPLGRTTTNAYDVLDRLVSVTDPRAGVTQYAYDALGNRTGVTDASGNVTHFTYDALNRLVLMTDPLGHSAAYGHDAVGNLTSATDRNGRLRTFTFDALNRQTGEAWWSGGSAVENIQYTYDAVGNLQSAGGSTSQYHFTYDALDRQTSADNAGTAAVPHVVLNYAYDAVGNRLSVQDDKGVQVASTYDARNLLVSRTWSGGGIAPARFDIQYDTAGQRTALVRWADVAGTQAVGQTSFTYDLAGRVQTLTHKDAGGQVLAGYQYTYDRAGQLTAESHHGVTFGYQFDAGGQLTSETRSDQPTPTPHAYDATGNQAAPGVVVGPDNQLLSDSRFNYTYDAEGNLVRKVDRASGDATTYTYDYRNRMTAVETRSSGGIILHSEQYRYDVFDRRIAVTVGAATTYTVYEGDHAWADYDGTGAVLTRYLFGNRMDEIVARWQPGTGTAWYLTDRLGTVRDLVNAAGQVINHLDYNAFGLLLSQTHLAVADRFTFTGREFDMGTGLFYYRARYYDPALQRFLSQDPLGFAAGDTNLYRYVGNNPVGATDPSGQLALIERVVIMAQTTLIGAGLGYLTGLICGMLEAWGQNEPFNQAATWVGILDKAHEGAKIGIAFGAIAGGLVGLWPALAQSSLLTVHLPLAGAFIAECLALPGLVLAAADRQHPNLFYGRLLCLGLQLAEIVLLPRMLQAMSRSARVVEPEPPVLGLRRPPGRAVGLHEGDLITEVNGLQTRRWASGPFRNPIRGTVGDRASKYLWTVDERGLNMAQEVTPWPTDRGMIVHTNLSSEASVAGEAWFGPGNRVTINAGSGRFGHNAGGATPAQYDAAARFFRSLGYEVEVIPYGQRGY